MAYVFVNKVILRIKFVFKQACDHFHNTGHFVIRNVPEDKFIENYKVSELKTTADSKGDI